MGQELWIPSVSTFLRVFQPSPASKFIQGYLGAVISAVSIAVSNPYPVPMSCCQGVGSGVCKGTPSYFSEKSL